MCGRYIQVSSPALLVEHFDVDETVVAEPPPPSYNVAPRAEVLTVVQRGLDDPQTAAEGGIRVLEPMRWGLVPSWAKDPGIGDRMINARAESLTEKAAFKTAYRKRRCLVPADGFYEWQTLSDKKKQPMFIHRRDGEPIAFAGLWEVWRPSSTEPWLLTCSIVTTRANGMMAPVHDRMPVMLSEDDWDTWLDVRIHDGAALEPLLDPPPDDLLEMWPVSARVNKADNDDADLVTRVEPEPEPEPPPSLF
jgi:putative SOS response-associated peptidase YedK